jgi:hypothetical protein
VIAVGANPGSTNLDEEIRRFEYKVEAERGARRDSAGFRYSLARAVYAPDRTLPGSGGRGNLAAGTSVRNAEFMKNELRVSALQ